MASRSRCSGRSRHGSTARRSRSAARGSGRSWRSCSCTPTSRFRGAPDRGRVGRRAASTIAAALNVHLSKIRKLLAAAGADATLVTELHGYVLRVDPERLDLHRFERLVRDGRQALVAGRAEEAAAALDRGLALWRGPLLAELALDASVEGTLARLGELRLSGLEDRFEAELVLGRHTELAAELDEFVREHPLRERARGPADGGPLSQRPPVGGAPRLPRGRTLLAEELGLDPGPERLEKAILVQDASLAAAAPHRLLRTSRARRFAAVGALALTAAGRAPRHRSGRRPQARTRAARRRVLRASDRRRHPPRHQQARRPRAGRLEPRPHPRGGRLRLGGGSGRPDGDRDRPREPSSPANRRRRLQCRRPGGSQRRRLGLEQEERALARLGEGQTWDRFEHPDFGQVERIALDDHAVWLAGGTR